MTKSVILILTTIVITLGISSQLQAKFRTLEGTVLQYTKVDSIQKKKYVYCFAYGTDPEWRIEIGLEHKSGGIHNAILFLPEHKPIAVVFSVIEGSKGKVKTFIGKTLTGKDVKIIFSKQKNNDYHTTMEWDGKSYQGKGLYN